MTKVGFLNLQTEVDELKNRMPVYKRAIADARELGDLKENAEYHAARESLGMLEAQISEKQNILNQAVIMGDGDIDKNAVQFGASVRLLDLKYDDEEEYMLVGAGEADPMNNRILLSSPMGAAMLNKKVGDIFVVDAPAGKMEYRILDICYE